MTEQMKPSGIERIGDIPHDWEISKIKYNVLIPVTDGPHETPVFVEEGIPFYSVDGIQNDHLVYEPCRYISYADANRYDAKVKPTYGDILMGKAASVGKIAIIDQHVRLQVWSPLAIIRTDEEKVHNQYLRYYLLSDPAQVEIDLKSTTNTQKNIAMEDIENLIITKPSIEEQKAITFFLNAQCAKIDGIVADIEKQIETLQKYKKSLITETVTKGFDKSAPMKDSGIEWIGNIPEHWSIKKIKYIASKIGSGKTPKGGAEIYEDEGITFIRSQNVYDDGLRLEDVKYISENIDAEMHATRLLFGDVLFNITGASIGRCCIYSLQDKGNVNQHVCIIRTNEKCYNDYLRYVLNSDIGKVQTAINQMGGNRDSLTFEQIGLFIFPLPPQHEQIEIANVLRDRCEHIDNIINGKKKQLTSIHQYKRSLIYEYVTGKKRVTEVN